MKAEIYFKFNTECTNKKPPRGILLFSTQEL